ncbi:AbiH family protein [Flavobacterium sp.]|uniref:AbiH family protein n=1 Tax=Flavobacterium sp. TaxID=239 RepID=UPI002B4B3C29|nr:AbiH family protein [Flavobacterium sp.]HLF53201.1 AbiH family protein [Flavobacterium sp.]
MINRLIILGNGFDLSHKLKTKYSDFIENYYSGIKDSSWKDDLLEFVIPGYVFDNMNSLKEIMDHMSSSLGEFSIMHPEKNLHINRKPAILLRNHFFYEISRKIESNWVDIEIEYFNKLLNLLDQTSSNNIYDEIKKLNKEVDSIAEKFECYLFEHVKSQIGVKYNEKTAQLFEDKLIRDSESIEEFLKEFPESYAKTIRYDLLKVLKDNNNMTKFDETLILNFNYTNTAEELYSDKLKNYKTINIHGSLNDMENPINLGFGDEMHKRYSDIEEKNENEYLRLMKSFAYTNTDNYRELFNFIEDKVFQVHIMGHSCGISDRTLLNAIFENKNCKSIKVFYHNYDKKNSKSQNDNYSEVVRNVSRHFNQKTLMRNKIVNKSLSSELPQFKI